MEEKSVQLEMVSRERHSSGQTPSLPSTTSIESDKNSPTVTAHRLSGEVAVI